MKVWIAIAAFITLLHPLPSADAAPPHSVSCKVQRTGGRGAPWKLATFEMVGTSFDERSSGCLSLLESMRETLDDLAPRSRRAQQIEFHVWLADVSTAGTIRFEARAWAVSARGRHLRHLARATAVARETSRVRKPERIAPRVARSALNRALRDLVSAIRRAARDQV